MIEHIGSTQDWVKWNTTSKQRQIIDDDLDCTHLYIDIYYIAMQRGKNSLLTKKQIKKMNKLIDNLNLQMVHAILRLSGEKSDQ